MQIEVTNFLGVEDVTLPLPETVVLVHGPNASGKTSLATAVAAILARTFNPLNLGPTKRPYVRDEAMSGAVVLRGKDGTEYRRWNLVERGIIASGDGPPDITKQALGLIGFINAPTKYRVDAWEHCFLPSPQELMEMVGEQFRKEVSRTAVLDEVMGYLRTRKWTEAEAIFTDQARRAKSNWHRITGESYGNRKADQWKPDGWRSELDALTPTEAGTLVEEAREALRLTQQGQAIRESEMQHVKRMVAEVPSIEKELDRLKADYDKAKRVYLSAHNEMTRISEAGQTLRQNLHTHDEKQPVREDTENCPACGESLVVTPDRTLVRARDESAFDAHMQAWKVGRDRIDTKLKATREEFKQFKTSTYNGAKAAKERTEKLVDEAASRLNEAKRQANRAGVRVITDEDERRVAEAEQRVEEAKASQHLVNTRVAAQNEHLNAVNYGLIAQALGPRGIRRQAMQAKMAELGKWISQMLDVTKWEAIDVDATYSVTIAGRPAVMGSASEQWRAQFVLQSAIALVLGESRVIADGADILDSTGRRQFIELCNWLGERGVFVLAFSTGSLGEVPDYWEQVTLVGGSSG